MKYDRNVKRTNPSELSIVFIAGTLGQGGAERQLYYNLKTLNLNAYKTYLISLTKGQYWEKEICEIGTPIFFAGKEKNRIIRLKNIINIVRDINPVFIQSQHTYTNIYAGVAGKILRKISIGAIRSDGFFDLEEAGKFLGKLSIKLPDCLAINSMAGLNYAKESGIRSSKLRFLPNTIDTAMFRPPLEKKINAPVTIVLISNLWYSGKRIDLLIQALGRLKNIVNRPLSAKIIGEGPLLEMLQKIGKENKVYPGMVEFMGYQSTIEEIYRQADIFVLTSDHEGTPNVIMEAMASGLPVIATKVGGIPYLLQDNITGFLIQPGNLDELTEKLHILVENVELRKQMGNAGRQYIVANHSLKNLPEMLNNFYRSLQ